MSEVSDYIDPYKVQQIKVAVDAVCISYNIKTNEKKVLLIKRQYEPFSGMWAIPGGFLNENEEMEDGALRELIEETDIALGEEVEPIQIGAYGKLNRDPRKRRIISVAFLFRLTETKPVRIADESLGVQWVDIIELNKENLAFDHYDILQDALKLL